jgi:hypothetical protein
LSHLYGAPFASFVCTHFCSCHTHFFFIFLMPHRLFLHVSYTTHTFFHVLMPHTHNYFSCHTDFFFLLQIYLHAHFFSSYLHFLLYYNSAIVSMEDILGECQNPACFTHCLRYHALDGRCAHCACPAYQHKLLGIILLNGKVEWLPATSLKQSASDIPASDSFKNSTDVAVHSGSSISNISNKKIPSQLCPELNALYNRHPFHQQVPSSVSRFRGSLSSTTARKGLSNNPPSKKARLDPAPIVSLFILPQGENAPTSAVIREGLKQRKQYYPDFPYFDENSQQPILPVTFEKEYLDKSQIASLFCVSKYKYEFLQQKGAKTPIQTGFSNDNFPSLDI